MSPVKREWLVHGCMRLSDHDKKDRTSLKVRGLISHMHGGEEFSIKQWPQRGFRDTLWWYEKSVDAPGSAASYFLKLDNRRGPQVYAGITVEKGFEDDALAAQAASEFKQPARWWRLDESWDWHSFVSSLNQIEPLVHSAAETLQSELYVWLEFADSRYYVASQGQLYERLGFKPVAWSGLHGFVSRPRPTSYGGVYIVRSFSLGECTPRLGDDRLLGVYQALRPVRDIWRGIRTG